MGEGAKAELWHRGYRGGWHWRDGVDLRWVRGVEEAVGVWRERRKEGWRREFEREREGWEGRNRVYWEGREKRAERGEEGKGEGGGEVVKGEKVVEGEGE